jgi:hypothetical protein
LDPSGRGDLLVGGRRDEGSRPGSPAATIPKRFRLRALAPQLVPRSTWRRRAKGARAAANPDGLAAAPNRRRSLGLRTSRRLTLQKLAERGVLRSRSCSVLSKCLASPRLAIYFLLRTHVNENAELAALGDGMTGRSVVPIRLARSGQPPGCDPDRPSNTRRPNASASDFTGDRRLSGLTSAGSRTLFAARHSKHRIEPARSNAGSIRAPHARHCTRRSARSCSLQPAKPQFSPFVCRPLAQATQAEALRLSLVPGALTAPSSVACLQWGSGATAFSPPMEGAHPPPSRAS